MTRRADLPHCVYRLFAADGHLLYIGCSHSPMARVGNHLTAQTWGGQIAAVTFEWFENGAQGFAVEEAAISAELPEWNVHNRPNPKHNVDRLHPLFVANDPSTWRVRPRHYIRRSN